VFLEHSALFFAESLMRLQNALASLPGLGVDYIVVPDLKGALSIARERKQADALVFLHPTIGFPEQFVLRALGNPEAKFVAGIFPEPTIDWDRVVRTVRDGGAGEEPRFAGCVYNVDPEKAQPVPGNGHLSVTNIPLGAAVLKRDVLDAIDYLVDDSLPVTDSMVCDAWAHHGQIWADLDSPCSKFGSLGFSGCIGARCKPRA
jgi:hypothetical protein